MTDVKREEPVLQWHPAFFASLQIELCEENFWLKNLTDDLPDRVAVETLVKEYHEHRKNTLYRSVMDVIIRANEELFKEESDMCEAIIDLFRDEYDKGAGGRYC